MQSARARWLWWESWIWSEHRSSFHLWSVGSYHLGGRWARATASARGEPVLLLLSTSSCPDGGGGRSWRSLTCSLELHILLAPSNGPFGTEGGSAAIRGWSGCAVKAGVHYGMVPTCQPELQTATCQPTASTEGQQWLLSPPFRCAVGCEPAPPPASHSASSSLFKE